MLQFILFRAAVPQYTTAFDYGNVNFAEIAGPYLAGGAVEQPDGIL